MKFLRDLFQFFIMGIGGTIGLILMIALALAILEPILATCPIIAKIVALPIMLSFMIIGGGGGMWLVAAAGCKMCDTPHKKRRKA